MVFYMHGDQVYKLLRSDYTGRGSISDAFERGRLSNPEQRLVIKPITRAEVSSFIV